MRREHQQSQDGERGDPSDNNGRKRSLHPIGGLRLRRSDFVSYILILSRLFRTRAEHGYRCATLLHPQI